VLSETFIMYKPMQTHWLSCHHHNTITITMTVISVAFVDVDVVNISVIIVIVAKIIVTKNFTNIYQLVLGTISVRSVKVRTSNCNISHRLE